MYLYKFETDETKFKYLTEEKKDIQFEYTENKTFYLKEVDVVGDEVEIDGINYYLVNIGDYYLLIENLN